MILNKKKFDKLAEEGLLYHRQNGNLHIYNYTQTVQFDKKWDKFTMMARGLILRDDGYVVARPFPKFFNMGERENTMIKNLPITPYEVSEKLDGSLGILYKDDDGYKISTRGVFDSEQAFWATKWLKNHGGDKMDWKENMTYLFEIIHPLNRIVVDYGERSELVLIALVHNWTGHIHPYKEVVSEAKRLGFSHPKMFNMSISEIEEKSENSKANEEGFVLFYPDNQLMLKVKLKDYVRLHRLTFGISVKSIWENMMEGKDIEDVFKDAPDEVYDWIKNWKNYFRKKEQAILSTVTEHLNKIKDMKTRKEQALYLQKEAPQFLGIVFSMIDNKPYLKGVYNLFKPAITESAQTYKYIKDELL